MLQYDSYDYKYWEGIFDKTGVYLNGDAMRKIGKPKGKVKLLFTYNVDCNKRIVYSVGVDEEEKYYIVEEHEYNIGSAYSVYRDYYLIDDSEVEQYHNKAGARERSLEEKRLYNAERAKREAAEREQREEERQQQDMDRLFYRKKHTDIIWWLKDTSDGQFFTFDRVKLYDLKADYPGKLTAEQKEIFDSENAFMAASYRKNPWTPCESRVPDVIHHMRYGKFTYEETKMFYEYRGNRYMLGSHPYEPCLYLVSDGKCIRTLHNAFTVEKLRETFLAGETICDGLTDTVYDANAFCRVLAITIESGREDMDFPYAAKLAAGRIDTPEQKA